MVRFMFRSWRRMVSAGAMILLAVVPGAIAGCGEPGEQVYRDDYQEIPPYTVAPVIETPGPDEDGSSVEGEAAQDERE